MGCCVSRSQDSELSPDTILGKPYADIGSDYTIGEELGRGHFGTTYLCVEKSTGKQYACKSISKGGIVGRSEKVNVRREVETMRLLSGKPNIVEFKAAYEDDQFVHIVMEYCAGGTLVDRILDRGHYSERDARLVIRSIVNAVSACHCNGVIHRDLKPENFLFTTDDEDATLKASDFGLSFFFEKGDDSDDDMGIVGTHSYLAPEIYNHIYGKQIDIWSAGVILYNLLSGAQPFAAGTDSEGQIPPTSEEARALALAVTERERLNAYKTRKIDFKSDPWPAISDNAKDLIREMLHPDPYRRITATKVLRHPWLKYEDGEASEPIDPAVIYRLKQFRAMNKLKKLALKVIVENLPSDEIRKHKETFKAMDTDDSGSLTYDELKAGLAKLGSTLGEVDIKQCMEAADLDGNGAIDYIEFVTCTTPRHKLERYQHLNKAFKYFDKNNDRFISVDELEAAFKESKGDDDGTIIDDIMSEVDRDKDGRISYDEFYAMMKTKTCLTEASSRNLSHIFLEKNSESL